MLPTFEWPHSRPPAMGRRAAIASAHPRATQAGARILAAGGNAIDAIVAVAAALGVVEPFMSGPGGVGFLLYSPAEKGPNLEGVQVLNFSGCAPGGATPDKFTPAAQLDGPRACLVPGCVAGWAEMLARLGTKPLAEVLAPAAELAEEGFALLPFGVQLFNLNWNRLNDAGRQTLADFAPEVGRWIRQPHLAQTLRDIGREGPNWFYTGPVGRKIADFYQAAGGLLSRADMAAYRPEWTSPISTTFSGATLAAVPPNSEAFQILQTLRLLERFRDERTGRTLASCETPNAAYQHLVLEAVKLAVADRTAFAGDPAHDEIPVAGLLDADYCTRRVREIRLDAAARSLGERWQPADNPRIVRPGDPQGSTTHFAVIDADGNMASITQSLGFGFGCGMYVPETGITLNNFSHWFEIDPRCPTPNLIAPGKRCASCLSPVHVYRGGRNFCALSTPGSYGILHTTVQMLLNVLHFNCDIQAAIDAPRFRVYEGTRVQVEERFPESVRAGLQALGHELELIGERSFLVGGAHGVMLDPATGLRSAGADPRRDGVAWAE